MHTHTHTIKRKVEREGERERREEKKEEKTKQDPHAKNKLKSLEHLCSVGNHSPSNDLLGAGDPRCDLD